MNKILLKLVLFFNPLWRKMGVNPKHLEVILSTKLKMDGRRVSTFTQNYRGKNKENLDVFTMLYFLLMGIFFLFFLSIFKIPITGVSIFLTVWLVMIMLTLISEFTDVLIDVRDNYILLPQAVNDKTLAVSRLLHIFLYLFRLVLAFILPSMIYMIFFYGILPALLFAFQNILCVLFAIFFVNVIYLLILQFISTQKFKEVINYFQIGFIILIMAGYYVLPNLIDFSALKQFNILDHPIRYFLPSIWIGAWWSVLIDGNYATETIALASLGLVVPVLLLYLVATVLSKKFSQHLMSIGQGGSSDGKPKTSSTNSSKNSLMNWWKGKLVSHPIENVGFESTWLITARSRLFKLKTYPMFGFIPAYFIYLALGGEGSLDARWIEFLNSDKYIMLIYLSIFGILIPIFNIPYSDQHKASWFFYALPIEQPGLILKGATKAIIGKFVIPIISITAILVFAIWGIKTLDDIAIGFINLILLTIIVGRQALKRMPFSESWENQSKGGNVAWSIMSMVLIGIIGFLHWSFSDNILVLLSWGIVGIGLIWYFLNSFDKLNWKAIK